MEKSLRGKLIHEPWVFTNIIDSVWKTFGIEEGKPTNSPFHPLVNHCLTWSLFKRLVYGYTDIHWYTPFSDPQIGSYHKKLFIRKNKNVLELSPFLAGSLPMFVGELQICAWELKIQRAAILVASLLLPYAHRRLDWYRNPLAHWALLAA